MRRCMTDLVQRVNRVHLKNDLRVFTHSWRLVGSWLMVALSSLNHGPSKKNASHGNEVLLQDTTHLIQRPCYQRGNLCQDPAGNPTTYRSPDHRRETQTAVVWSCLLFIKSGQNHLARHSENGKKTRQTEEEVERQLQGMDRPGVRQATEGSGEQIKMEGNWL